VSKAAKVVQFQLTGVVLVFDEKGDAISTENAQVVVMASEFDTPLRVWADALQKKADEALRIQERQEAAVPADLKKEVAAMPPPTRTAPSNPSPPSAETEDWDKD